MRPTPAEIVEGLQYNLKADLIPELQTPWGKRIAGNMLWALEHLKQRLEEEHALAVEENADLREVVAAAVAARAADAGLGEALATVELSPGEAREWPASEELTSENARLRTAVDAVVEAFPSEREGAAEDLWREILGYVARQTERDGKLIEINPG
ncbi:MAG: hypothetical protein F4Y92_02440 [Dehalococcoidia bacterium]|nr:hypothetical protein [Dehalococcoidia bacterium]